MRMRTRSSNTHLHLCVLIGACLGSPALARVNPTGLNELAGGAELIVIGDVTRVDAETFQFRVSRVVVGESSTRQIEVRKFQNWTCAWRWTDYAIEQRLLLFLIHDSEHPGAGERWRIIGGADEGEMPILNDDVYPGVRTEDGGLPPNRYTVFGGKRRRKMSLDALLSVVTDIRTCFQQTMGKRRHRIVAILAACDSTQLDALRGRSELHDFVVDETLKLAEELRQRWEIYQYHGLGFVDELRPEDALEYFELAIEHGAGFGRDSKQQAESLEEMARALASIGRSAEAQEASARAEKIRAKLAGTP